MLAIQLDGPKLSSFITDWTIGAKLRERDFRQYLQQHQFGREYRQIKKFAPIKSQETVSD